MRFLDFPGDLWTLQKTGRPRFGSVTVCGWDGSSGSDFRFRQFLCKKGFAVFQYRLTGKDGSGSGFGSWKTVPAVPVPLSASGKNGSDGSGSGSGSVPEPPSEKGDKAEKGRKRPIFGRSPGRAARHPFNPHLRQPKKLLPKGFLKKIWG